MTLTDPYDPDAFQAAGHRIVDTLAEYLRAAQRRELPVLSGQTPQELLEKWDEPIAAAPGARTGGNDDLLEYLAAILEHSNHLHHPGYVGHQVAVPLPASALVEMTNALLNNGMAVYEMGQLQTVMERRVLEFMGGVLGFDAGAGGVLTHGGSLGNLTALLAARQAMAGHDVWTEGQKRPMSVLVSDQAHYCIARAVQAMGWGTAGIQPVRTDAQYRMDVNDLPRALEQAGNEGRQVIAVVASCCSTATGSFDPVEGIADFCAEHGLWLHVDGAHGASLALSRRHRHRLAGIERADSVVWDLHKLMALPTLSTAVLFREERRAYEAFAQEASYLFQTAAPEEQWFNRGQCTLECTKRGMSVTAYCMLRLLGVDWFEAHVDGLMERAAWMHDMLEAAPDFEIASEPQANIVCFRHRPDAKTSGEELDRHQARLREAVLASGAFYLVQARVGGALWLRVTLMNPLTTREDLENLLATLRST